MGIFKHKETLSLGARGEKVAVVYLKKRGYKILANNFANSEGRRLGEIDIIAKKDGNIHFFEVKSIVCDLYYGIRRYHPEDNVHGLKLRHIRRMVETYFDEYSISPDSPFYFHVYCVYLDKNVKKAKVIRIENIIL